MYLEYDHSGLKPGHDMVDPLFEEGPRQISLIVRHEFLASGRNPVRRESEFESGGGET